MIKFKDCINECLQRNADYFSCNVTGGKFLGEKKYPKLYMYMFFLELSELFYPKILKLTTGLTHDFT